MRIRNWFRPQHHVLAVFVAVAVVSAGALAWLMWLLLEQDKAVEMQLRQERVEQAADRAAAVMQAALADLDRMADTPAGVLMLRIGRDGMVVRPPGSLLYYPAMQRGLEAPPIRFADGEQAEFARNDLKSAGAIYARLSADPDKAVRAGALTRLARMRRKTKDYDAAIRAYDQLAELTEATVSGLPAELVARAGRASVFEETQRVPDLQKEAASLDVALRSGRWKLTESEYEFYSAEARTWLGSAEGVVDEDAIARAGAAAWLWENRGLADPALRRLVQAGGNPALIVARPTSDGLVAAIAGPKYLAALCNQSVSDSALRCALSDADGHAVIGQSPPTRMAAIRTAATAKLPWTLHVFAPSDSGPAGASPRRQLLLWVAAVLTLVWFTGAAFIVRAIQREARVAQLQSDFVAAVSHEFRSPLSSLCQISEMLTADRVASDKLRHQAYAVLLREAERLSRLVEGLLDFQRFEAGAGVYRFEPVDLGPFLQSIVADFQARLTASNYSIELSAPEPPMHVKADREALSQAIWNLLDNAVKYSPECRTVWVDVERNQNRVSIAVRDRGLGIPLHEQREIFEKFVRGADSKARRIKGTGIGLAMVRHIVQAHGGEILVASQPGEGSRFTIVFPEEAAS